MIYFRTIEHISSSYLVGVGVEYANNQLNVGVITLNSNQLLPLVSDYSGVYGYVNISNSSYLATGRSFSVVNYVLKIPPSSLFGYNFIASKIKSF